jgi:hypothetical protein
MLRVLWLNWRDFEHPETGGSRSIYSRCHAQIGQERLSYDTFAERFPNRLDLKNIDGINAVRQGNSYTVIE